MLRRLFLEIKMKLCAFLVLTLAALWEGLVCLLRLAPALSNVALKKVNIRWVKVSGRQAAFASLTALCLICLSDLHY